MAIVPFSGTGNVACYERGTDTITVVPFEPLLVWLRFSQAPGYYDPQFHINMQPGTSPLEVCVQLINTCDPADGLVWGADGECRHQVDEVYSGLPISVPGCECCQTPCGSCGWSDCPPGGFPTPGTGDNGLPCCYGPGDIVTKIQTWGGYSTVINDCEITCEGGTAQAVYGFTGFDNCVIDADDDVCPAVVFGERISGHSCYSGVKICKCCVFCPGTTLGGWKGPFVNSLQEGCSGFGFCSLGLNCYSDPADCEGTLLCNQCQTSTATGEQSGSELVTNVHGEYNDLGGNPPVALDKLATPYLWDNGNWVGGTGMTYLHDGKYITTHGGPGGGVPLMRGEEGEEGQVENAITQPLCCGVSAEACEPINDCGNFPNSKAIFNMAGCNGDYDCCIPYLVAISEFLECLCTETQNHVTYTVSGGNCNSTTEQQVACWVWNGSYFETLRGTELSVYCCRPVCDMYQDWTNFISTANKTACVTRTPYAPGEPCFGMDCNISLFMGCRSSPNATESNRPPDVPLLEYLSNIPDPTMEK
jgi:hypothetical protein